MPFVGQPNHKKKFIIIIHIYITRKKDLTHQCSESFHQNSIEFSMYLKSLVSSVLKLPLKNHDVLLLLFSIETTTHLPKMWLQHACFVEHLWTTATHRGVFRTLKTSMTEPFFVQIVNDLLMFFFSQKKLHHRCLTEF